MAPSLPAEFLGQAREFRSRIERSYIAASALILPLLVTMKNRGRPPRREMICEFTLAFRKTDGFHRLHSNIRKKPGGIMITELRAEPAHRKLEHWALAEPCIDVVATLYDHRVRRCKVEHRLVASIGLHALCRRFQRGFNNSDAAILNDLASLVLLTDSNRSTDETLSLDFGCPSGNWVGSWMSDTCSQNIFACFRTFFSNDERFAGGAA
jgi:hypothetical protein